MANQYQPSLEGQSVSEFERLTNHCRFCDCPIYPIVIDLATAQTVSHPAHCLGTPFMRARTCCTCPGFVERQRTLRQAALTEFRDKKVVSLLTEGQINPDDRFTLKTWMPFHPCIVNGLVKIEAVQNYCQQLRLSVELNGLVLQRDGEFRLENNWLVLSGAKGLGKTHLAYGAAKRLVYWNLWQVRFVYWTSIVQKIQAGWHSSSAETGFQEGVYWKKLKSVELVVFDDLDKSSGTWELKKLLDVVNDRYTKKLPTIFTCNCPIEQLLDKWVKSARKNERAMVKDLGEAIIDRIEGRMFANIVLEGQSVRQA